MQKNGFPCWTGFLDTGVVVFVQVENQQFLSETRRITSIIQEIFRRHRSKLTFSVGIGPVCARPVDYPQAYYQAQQAIEIGRRLRASEESAEYAKLGSYALLYETSKNPATEPFVERVLGPILNYDRKNNSDLIKTLQAYLENNGNLRQTAKKTHTHLNTVRYRLARIEELTRKNLKNAHDFFEFQLAVNLFILSGKTI